VEGDIPPIHILVCAPSNAAIDELLRRLGKKGALCDAQGATLSQVRVGAGANEDYSLEKRMAELASPDQVVQDDTYAVEKAQLRKTLDHLGGQIDQVSLLFPLVCLLL
jgi:hypothetical protein